MSTSHALIGWPIVRSFLEELSSICLSFAADIFTPHSRRLPDYKLREIMEEHKAGLPSTAVLNQVSFSLLHPPRQLPYCESLCTHKVPHRASASPKGRNVGGSKVF